MAYPINTFGPSREHSVVHKTPRETNLYNKNTLTKR